MVAKQALRTSDEFLLNRVLVRSGGFVAGQSYYVEGNYGRIRAGLKKLCGGKATCRRSGTGWTITPSVAIPAPTPVPEVVTPPNMVTRGTVAEVVKYLKRQPMGAVCGMRFGPKENKNLATQFLQRGLRVSYRGQFGNRLITSVALDDSYVIKRRQYIASKRTTDRFVIGNLRATQGIPANVPTFVQGNYNRLTAQLRRYAGSGNYKLQSVKVSPQGPGYLLTLAVPILRG